MSKILKVLTQHEKFKELWEEYKAMSGKWKLIILTMAVLLVAIVVSSGIMGCATPSEQYVEANYKNANTALPDLIEYISNDEKLSKLDKEVRVKSVHAWWDLIKDSYRRYHAEKVE